MIRNFLRLITVLILFLILLEHPRKILDIFSPFYQQEMADLTTLSFGSDSTFDIVSWNLSNFPMHESTPIKVEKILLSLQADVYALQEIKDTILLKQIVGNIPGYKCDFRSNNYGGLAYVYNSNTIKVNSKYEIFPIASQSVQEALGSGKGKYLAIADKKGSQGRKFATKIWKIGMSVSIDGGRPTKITKLWKDANKDVAAVMLADGTTNGNIMSMCKYNDIRQDTFPRKPQVLDLVFNEKNFFIINNHFICCGDGILNAKQWWDEENRKMQAAIKLKEYIDNNLDEERVIVVGDLNDQLIDSKSNNVFQDIINDSLNFLFVDMNISLGNPSNWSCPQWPAQLDHILITNELFFNFQHPNSEATVIKIDEYLPSWDHYHMQISDHRPIGLKLNL